LLYSDSNDEELDVLAFKKSIVKGAVIHLEHHDTDMSEKGWENLFRLAAQEDIPIILNSFDGDLEKKTHLPTIEKAIKYTEIWSNRLYVLNVASQREIDLIQEGRERSLLIYAETNPKHLFPEDTSEADCLWKALNDGVIETLGSGFSLAHKNKDKILFRDKEHNILDPFFLFPLLLTAFKDKNISLEQFTELTSSNIQNILEFEKNQDCVLVDLEKEEVIHKVFNGNRVEHKLIGWPVYTIVKGKVFVN
jgi:dihydroorotase